MSCKMGITPTPESLQIDLGQVEDGEEIEQTQTAIFIYVDISHDFFGDADSEILAQWLSQ